MSSNTGSSRSRSASFAVLLFILAAIDLNADQRVLISLSAFTENEINNEAYASRNLFLVPGLSFAVRGLEFPMYGRLQFENRMNTGSMATNSYLDTELRYRVHFGGTLELIPGFTYNPEYEARIKSYVGYSFEDYFTWENRFHQNFFLPFSSSLGLTFKAMPTWMIANTGSDSRGEGIQSIMISTLKDLWDPSGTSPRKTG